MGDEYDLFKFSNSGKIKAGGSLMAKLSGSSSNSANIDIAGKYQKSSKSTAGAVSSSSYPASSEDYSGEDFDDDDDDDDDNDERKVSRRLLIYNIVQVVYCICHLFRVLQSLPTRVLDKYFYGRVATER